MTGRKLEVDRLGGKGQKQFCSYLKVKIAGLPMPKGRLVRGTI